MAPEYFYPLLGVVFVLGWGVLGTARWYLAQRLRGSTDRLPGRDAERIAQLEARLGELEERVDFAERLLTRGREGTLPDA